MNDTVKVRVWVKTLKIGSKVVDTIKVPRDEWNSMTDDARDEMCRDAIFRFVEWGWKEVN